MRRDRRELGTQIQRKVTNISGTINCRVRESEEFDAVVHPFGWVILKTVEIIKK